MKEILYTVLCILFMCAALFLPWYVMFNVTPMGDQVLWLLVTVFVITRTGRLVMDRLG